MATVPTLTSWVAGELLTGAKMNAQIKDPLAFLLNPPRATMSRTGAAQTLTTATYTDIVFDTENFDSDGMVNLGTLNTGMTVQTNGYFDVLAGVSFAANATGGRIVRITLNGTPIAYTATAPPTGLVCLVQTKIMHTALNVGDVVKAQAYQSSGGNLGTTNAGAGDRCFLSVRWIAA